MSCQPFDCSRCVNFKLCRAPHLTYNAYVLSEGYISLHRCELFLVMRAQVHIQLLQHCHGPRASRLRIDRLQLRLWASCSCKQKWPPAFHPHREAAVVTASYTEGGGGWGVDVVAGWTPPKFAIAIPIPLCSFTMKLILNTNPRRNTKQQI